MNRSLIYILLTLFACTALTLMAEYGVRQHHGQQRDSDMQKNMATLQLRLQAIMDELVADNRTLADRLQQQPDAIEHAEAAGLLDGIKSDAPVISLALSRGHKIVYVHPYAGNEAALGVDYQFRPEFMRALRRAIQSRDTVITSKVTLLQTGKPGLILRTPFFSGDQHLGTVSTTVDIAMLLDAARPATPAIHYQLLIRASHPLRGASMVQGDNDEFGMLQPGVLINLPEGATWELRGQLDENSPAQALSADLVRLAGCLATTLLILFMLKRSGVLTGLVRRGQGTALRFALLLLALLPVLLLTLAVEVAYYKTVQHSARQLMNSQAEALARQARSRTEAFFDIPRQAAFAAELFRQDILDPRRPEEMLGFFVSQLRIQPQLTFLSMANTEGEYYAASRPPRGQDRNIRMQWATLETGREMQVHWANDSNRPSKAYVRGNPDFDARTTLWYQQALERQSLQWYPVYRYNTRDSKNQYDDFGIGMSAPLYNSGDQLIGVITADVALSQLGDFLRQQSRDLGGTLFLAERSGQLLATTDDGPIYRQDQTTTQRLTASQSDNPLIRTAALHMDTGSHPAGSNFLAIDGQMHLLDWHLIDIPDGPDLILGVIVPSDILAGTAHTIWRDALYIGWLVLLFTGVVVLFATNWLTGPLSALERWASQLRNGNWPQRMPAPGPIQEVISLADSLEFMAQELRHHTTSLEELVNQRTEELRLANQQLEQLSLTDSLTGLANRRSLDEHSLRLWQQAVRKGTPLALIMVDIDWFKKYNDHYGHLTGDEALVRVARILAAHARRPDDLAARYGGEEFVLLLPDTPAETAEQLARMLCRAVADGQIEHNLSPHGHITISAGLAVSDPGARESSLESLFQQADLALYHAKNNGRNQPVIRTGAPTP